MLATYFKRQATRTTYYASSAGPYLDEFTDWLAHRGYREEVIGQYLPGVVEFANWVNAAYGDLVSCSDDVVNHFHDHLAKRGRLRYSSGQHSIPYRGAQRFVEFLQIQQRSSAPRSHRRQHNRIFFVNLSDGCMLTVA